MKPYVLLFGVGLLVFGAFAGPRLKIHSQDNHFVYQADAFLQGSLELTRRPHHQNDWATYETLQLKGESASKFGPEVSGFFTRRSGKPNEFRTLQRQDIEIPPRDRKESTKHTYVSFPPMPALVMLPSVAVIGYGTNDVIITVAFAALNVALVFALLRLLRARGHTQRTDRELVWLTVLFAFGTAHLWCSVLGQVWFTALVMGVTFQLGFVYFAVDARRPLLAGLCMAAAFSTRATLVVAALFFYLQLFWPSDGQRQPPREILKRFALFSAPCLAAGLLLMWFNDARFADPMEFGHTYLAGGTIPRIRDWGLFHPHFIERNLAAAFATVPKITEAAPYLKLSKHGMSLLITTPALLWLFWPRRTSAPTRRLARQMALTTLVVVVPIVLYQNTGWEQFGFRFLLDFLPWLIALLAIGTWRLGRLFQAAVIVGILVNAFGAVTFQRPGFEKLYGDHLPAKLD